MSASMKSLGIDQWSREDRWQLVEEICQSLFDRPEEFLSPDDLDELKECIADYRKNPGAGTPWRTVMDRIDAGE